jgi:hypothetical protein
MRWTVWYFTAAGVVMGFRMFDDYLKARAHMAYRRAQGLAVSVELNRAA